MNIPANLIMPSTIFNENDILEICGGCGLTRLICDEMEEACIECTCPWTSVYEPPHMNQFLVFTELGERL